MGTWATKVLRSLLLDKYENVLHWVETGRSNYVETMGLGCIRFGMDGKDIERSEADQIPGQ